MLDNHISNGNVGGIITMGGELIPFAELQSCDAISRKRGNKKRTLEEVQQQDMVAHHFSILSIVM